MKNKLIRGAAIVMTVTMTAGLMSGCTTSTSNKQATKDGDKTLFSYDGTDVSLKEAWIYAKMTAAQYESYYTSYFGSDFWGMDMGTDDEGNATTFESYVKEQVITQIKQIIVLNNKAEELDCSLSEDDETQCEEYAKAFAEDASGKAILEECGGTEEDMVAIYEDNALASKVQEVMVKDTDTNVTDDEARKSKIYRIVYPTTTTDADGNTTDMTEEEKAQAKASAQTALTEIQGGKSIEDVASEQEYTDTDETFAKGESEEGEAFETLIAGMKDGDVVSEVQECDNGYVVAKLVAYTDADATEENKTSIISERQQKTFSDTYEEWTKDLEADWSYKEDVDQTLWAEVVLRSADSTATESSTETTGAPAESTTAVMEGETAAQNTETPAEATTVTDTEAPAEVTTTATDTEATTQAAQ